LHKKDFITKVKRKYLYAFFVKYIIFDQFEISGIFTSREKKSQ